MKANEGLGAAVIAGLIGVIGSCLGALVAGNYAADAAKAQIDVQLSLLKSETALKLLEYRAEPMASLYAAISRFDNANLQGEELFSAARALAAAAASCAARLDGKASVLCSRIQSTANNFVHISPSDIEQKMRANDLINANFFRLKKVYASMQDAAIKAAIGEGDLKASTIRVAKDPVD
ncbi:hypothetical protein [Pseudomonas sp. P5_C3]